MWRCFIKDWVRLYVKVLQRGRPFNKTVDLSMELLVGFLCSMLQRHVAWGFHSRCGGAWAYLL